MDDRHNLRDAAALSTVTSARPLDQPQDDRIPGLTIVGHPEVRRIGERVVLTAVGDGGCVSLSRLTPRFHRIGDAAPSPLLDPHVSRKPIRLVASEGGVMLMRDETHYAIEADGEAVGESMTFDVTRLERGVVLMLAGRVVLVLHLMPRVARRGDRDMGMVGVGHAIAKVRAEIARVARLDVPVLVRGETGTGKELAARAIHQHGPRRGQAFVAVNMAAVPPTLAAAELFGAEKGAFTGADRRRQGFFREAHGGTLFLDEIGEAPIEIQTLLLRALETGRIRPVGSERTVEVDVRIVTATDTRLEAAIQSGQFRAPLLHRLSGYALQLPPLRDRREDFGVLLVHFLRHELATLGAATSLLELDQPTAEPWLPASLVARLARGHWPGNIRQLRNAARQISIDGFDRPYAAWPAGLTVDAPIQAHGTPTATALDPPNEASTGTRPPTRRRFRKPSDVSEDELVASLRRNRWRLQPTARDLGVSRTSLYKLIDDCPRIRKASTLDADELRTCADRCDGDIDAMAQAFGVSRHGLLLRINDLGLHDLVT